MALNKSDAVEIVTDQLLPIYRKERERLDRIDLWYRWRHEDPVLPRAATRELKRLVELSRTPWLGLVVTNVAQALYVDGYRSPELKDNSGPWRTWQGNDFDNRQIPVHRAALAYGLSNVVVTPGTGPDGEPMAVMRGVSPRKMVTIYGDEVDDDWPMFALWVDQVKSRDWALRLYDEENIYMMSCDSSGSKVQFIEPRVHDAGVTPVVRYANMLDLDGRADGEVEPFISTAARINKTAFDRLITQHFASWKVRTVAGMAQPDTQEESNRKKLQLRQDDILVAEDADTKFGTLDETPLDGYIRAYESDIADLAAVTQNPPLLNNVANLSADAIAELRAGLTQKVFERQKTFGKSHAQALRLAAHLEGNDDGAQDVMAQVTWADMQIRSLSQAVDALGKAAQMLGIPPQALWARIPGVTKSDVDEWKQIAEGGDPLSALNRLIADQAAAVNPPVPPPAQ